MRSHIALLTAWLVTSLVSAQEPAPKPEPKPISHTLTPPGVTCMSPGHWVAQESKSAMRLVQWKVGEKETAEIVVYWFGKDQGGGVEENFTRWKSQIEGDKSPKTSTPASGPEIKVHLLDTRGTYVAPLRPGSPERHKKEGQRLLGAVVETPGGNLYVKAVGPAAVLDAEDAAILKWLGSFKVAPR